MEFTLALEFTFSSQLRVFMRAFISYFVILLSESILIFLNFLIFFTQSIAIYINNTTNNISQIISTEILFINSFVNITLPNKEIFKVQTVFLEVVLPLISFNFLIFKPIHCIKQRLQFRG